MIKQKPPREFSRLREKAVDIAKLKEAEKTALETRCQELEKKVKERTADVEELQKRLEEAEETIEALRRGDVGAVVVGSGEEGSRTYALEGPDRPYRNIVETMNAGVVAIDEQGVIFYSNGAFSKMTGIPLRALLGSSFKDLVVPEDLPLFLDFVKKARELEKTTEEIAIRRRRGKLFVRLAGSAQTAYDIERICIVITDVTERKRTEEALRRQADLLELAYSAIIVRDLESRITFWNNGAEKAYGWTRDEADGAVAHRLLKTRFPVSLDDAMTTIMQTDKWEGELEHTTKDGRKITVLSRHALQRDDAGNPAAVMEINLDITAARQFEAHLRHIQKMEALGTFSSGIAHDFNNILAAIIGFTELVEDRVPKGSREAHHLKRVLESSLRGRDLVRQVLTFSRKTEQAKKPLSLNSMVNETVGLIRAATPTTIGIRVNALSESGLILADPGQIRQVIMNLCTNAAHAMQEKGGSIDIQLNDHSVSPSNGDPHGLEPGLYTRLIVRDTGAGMSPDIMDKIFDPFFTTKEPGRGTGLGLSIVHGIVKRSNGHITVESEPGRGSTFTVYFPQITGGLEADAVSDGKIPTGAERILFVDDEEAIVEMSEKILAELGYDVTSRMSGSEALALFRLDPSKFDLIITDQTMPEMTGIALAKEVLAVRKDIPIILFTGYSDTVSPEKAKAAGIRESVMKPITKRETARTIRRVLDDCKGPEAKGHRRLVKKR